MDTRRTRAFNIKAVFFDFDDTLISTTEADKRAMLAVAALAAVKCPEVDSKHLLKCWHSRFRASPWDPLYQVPVEEWRTRLWQYSLTELGCANPASLAPEFAACFHDARLGNFQLFPGVRGFMRRLKAHNIKTAIITNGHAEVQRAKLEQVEAEGLCDFMVLGGEEVIAGRQEKPAASIFLTACRLCGCEAHQAVHVGDSLITDIQGGANAGLAATVWVNRNGVQLPSEAASPDFTIAHVTELGLLLEEMCGLPRERVSFEGYGFDIQNARTSSDD